MHLTTAAAAAKSLQSCPTLCDPIDGSPLGCPPIKVVGIISQKRGNKRSLLKSQWIVIHCDERMSTDY